ncbi:hypothetical protein C9374_008329 [Naegleria lovaniensis]|uniref:Uncharacterized protein n=1 Tax=Naegleria lovaniensis TaxID=51637 RepID=A0AA88GKL3_NAELO|nr:uncharacterized protein C9374_008329 [Naegleria lovaniensis]KAG2378186.1 hypothetical protein C9374_008329 [Naegleria lovaniensis]
MIPSSPLEVKRSSVVISSASEKNENILGESADDDYDDDYDSSETKKPSTQLQQLFDMIQKEQGLVMEDSKSDIMSTVLNTSAAGSFTSNIELQDDQSSIDQTSQTSLGALGQMKELSDEVLGGGFVLEVVTVVICVLYYLSLIVAFAIRPSFINMGYLLIFFIHNLAPSYYPYFQRVPINYIWMMIPRFYNLILSFLLAVSCMIGHIVLSALSNLGTDEENILRDVGFAKLSGKGLDQILIHVLPDCLLIVFSLLVFIFLAVLWKKRRSLIRDGIPLKIKKALPTSIKGKVIMSEESNKSPANKPLSITSSDNVEIEIGQPVETPYRMQTEDVVTDVVTTSNTTMGNPSQTKPVEVIPKLPYATMNMWELPGVFAKKPKLITTTLENLKNKVENIGTMADKNAKTVVPQKHISIHDFKVLLFTLSCMITACFYPGFVSVFYLSMSFIVITFTSFNIKLKTGVTLTLFILNQAYSMLLLIFYFLTRFQYNSLATVGQFSKMILTDPYGKMAGFFDIDGNLKNFDYFSKYYTGYVFLVFILLTFILSCNFMSQYFAKSLEENKLKKQISKFLMEYSKKIMRKDVKENSDEYYEDIYYKSEYRRLVEIMETATQTSTNSLFASSHRFRNFMLYYLQRSILYILLIALICVVLTVPSLSSLPYLLFMYLGLVLAPSSTLRPNKIMLFLLPICYIWSILYLSAQYVFQFPEFSAYSPKTTQMSDNVYNPSGSGGLIFYPVQGILYRVIVSTTVGAFITDISVNGRSIVLVLVLFGQLLLTLFLGLTLRVSLFSKLIDYDKDVKNSGKISTQKIAEEEKATTVTSMNVKPSFSWVQRLVNRGSHAQTKHNPYRGAVNSNESDETQYYQHFDDNDVDYYDTDSPEKQKMSLLQKDHLERSPSKPRPISSAFYYESESDLGEVAASPLNDQTSNSYRESVSIVTERPPQIVVESVDMTELDKLKDEADNNLGEVDGEEKKQKTLELVWKKTKQVLNFFKVLILDYFWKVLLILFVRNSFYLSLIVCYFADLTSENADLLHAIYCKYLKSMGSLTNILLVIFCSTYFIFPNFARKTWIVLVLYCQFVIIALYFFNVWYAPEIVDLPYEIIGFNPAFLTIDNMDKTFSFGVFWRGLIWHIFILILTSIQYHITNVKNVGNVNIETSFDRWELFTKEKNATLHTFVEKCKMVWDKIFLETELLYFLGTLLSYFAVFLLIFLQKEASWIGFLFLVIVMICFTLNVVSSSATSSSNKMGYRLFKVFVASWYIFVFYSTFVFVVEYAYQFPSLYSYIQSILPEVERAQQLIREHEEDKSVYIPPYYGYITPRSIGLYKYQYKNVSLLPFTVIAVLTIIQLKYFQYVISRRRNRMKLIKEECAGQENQKEKDQKKQEDPSLVDEIVDTIQEDPSNVK